MIRILFFTTLMIAILTACTTTNPPRKTIPCKCKPAKCEMVYGVPAAASQYARTDGTVVSACH